MKHKEVLKLVDTFSKEYRGRNLKPFTISENYDLFSTSSDSYGWTHEWPNNGRYGVYLIMDKDENVIYIGESRNVGKRLGSYFQKSGDSSCEIVNDWSEKPKYVCTIAVEAETWFERLALEEFLIYYAKPEDNKKGKQY